MRWGDGGCSEVNTGRFNQLSSPLLLALAYSIFDPVSIDQSDLPAIDVESIPAVHIDGGDAHDGMEG